VLSVDEKSQIQALERSAPTLPLQPRLAERRSHDHVRHGSSTLFAALEIETGKVTAALVRPSRRVPSGRRATLCHRSDSGDGQGRDEHRPPEAVPRIVNRLRLRRSEAGYPSVKGREQAVVGWFRSTGRAMERAFRASVVVTWCNECWSRGCPRQDSNLRTRLRRPVKPADSLVSGLLSSSSAELRLLQRPRPTLIRPTNRSTREMPPNRCGGANCHRMQAVVALPPPQPHRR
jgi:hypothetical protein